MCAKGRVKIIWTSYKKKSWKERKKEREGENKCIAWEEPIIFISTTTATAAEAQLDWMS